MKLQLGGQDKPSEKRPRIPKAFTRLPTTVSSNVQMIPFLSSFGLKLQCTSSLMRNSMPRRKYAPRSRHWHLPPKSVDQPRYSLSSSLSLPVIHASMHRPPTKIYIPTVARYITAPVAQIQFLDENVYSALIGYGPKSAVRFLVRYLFLEISSQRKTLLPQLDSTTRTPVEQILDSYKRTHKLNISDFLTQHSPPIPFFEWDTR